MGLKPDWSEHGQEVDAAERPLSRDAQGYLFRREQDSQNPSQDGKGRAVEGSAEGFHETSSGNRRPGEAPQSGLQDHRQAGAGEDLRGHQRHHRRGGRDHEGLQGNAGARRGPSRGGSGGRALRDVALWHASYLGRRTWNARRSQALAGDTRRRGSNGFRADQARRVPGQCRSRAETGGLKHVFLTPHWLFNGVVDQGSCRQWLTSKSTWKLSAPTAFTSAPSTRSRATGSS